MRGLETIWYSGRPQAGGEELLLDLGTVVPIADVELALGWWVLHYPRELTVTVSPDGVAWTEVWRGNGDLPAIEGALREPRRVPLVLDLGGHPGRLIRIRQVGRHRSQGWAVAEIVVRASRGRPAGAR